jgi:hypothetical protein
MNSVKLHLFWNGGIIYLHSIVAKALASQFFTPSAAGDDRFRNWLNSCETPITQDQYEACLIAYIKMAHRREPKQRHLVVQDDLSSYAH